MKIRGNTIGTPLKPEKNLIKATDLIEEEKAQARANIGAVASVNGTTPDENGNVQIETGGGGSTADAVLYTKQTLTTAQQTQARQNIGAADAATIGDISAALTELHNYAEVLKGGDSV